MMREIFDDIFNETEDEMAVAFWVQMTQMAISTFAPKGSGGSQPGKAGNIPRDYAGAHMHYMRKYFWPTNLQRPGTSCFGPEQRESAFERRFRMPRAVFDRVITAAVAHSDYLRQGLRPDATGRVGISPLLKVICALRQFSYGIPSDLSDDLFDVSETTAQLCLQHFCDAVNKSLGPQYLREPTGRDLLRIEQEFRAAGFPGCIGCLDCSGWDWKICPIALQGIMRGKEGTSTLRIEVICSLDLWIWSFQFGLPGAMNDLDVFEVSNHFANVLNGSFPPIIPSYKIAGMSFSRFYYLTGGIYPPWQIFVQTLAQPADQKGELFAKTQESIRKCVERVFGALFRRFKMLFIACEFWTMRRMRSICTAAVILHNMIVEARRDYYESDGTGGRSIYFDDGDEEAEILFLSMPPGSMPLFASSSVTVSDDIKVGGMQRDLVKALIEHHWERSGACKK